ncbi:phosphomevalonate kinase [Cordyceps fumosorosea ARSEF 2679]|uniref:Phosphomevalonate kinase n=1 Tax=Cordyceps fumosorosea (strain ARSEF 2679) TaxID=1081104 RepID=A0A167UEV3_CORFA|nr:phosphomevalonate kinase [Cordyceps fumosorosea ARSEF 2679]OAA61517.1 phosphomevalonate kinase [Cordyceps fumosorosea ARSEF 2679]
MSTATHPDVAISAPGKVLLAGGYLVLDRKYTGLVFGLDARISVIAGQIHSSAGVQLNEIVVDSPQFLEAQWRYGYHLAPEGGGIKVTQLQVGGQVNPNPFVETTLNYALTYANTVTNSTTAPSSSRLVILADNDYYSNPATTDAPGRFAKFGVTLREAHKTGLGSSAALVTALTAALLTHYLPRDRFDASTDAGRAALHNLAQAAHCAAQGKVGSGFDVAAAVYGSCTYRRFSPSVLAGIPEAGAPGFAARLVEVVDDRGAAWDVEVKAADGLRMPRGVTLRMCDVDCGSQTVGMVKQVLAWRAQDAAGSTRLWDELQARNEALAQVLRNDALGEVPSRIQGVRELIRAMGERSGVPIEPPAQTELLDAAARVEGVHGGVVPGAGGFDAAALLMDDDEATERRVVEFLARWSAEKGGKVKLLSVRGEMEGVRREQLDVYEGWL